MEFEIRFHNYLIAKIKNLQNVVQYSVSMKLMIPPPYGTKMEEIHYFADPLQTLDLESFLSMISDDETLFIDFFWMRIMGDVHSTY